jgi:dihydropyrimidine dehydrogenase (NADP+)
MNISRMIASDYPGRGISMSGIGGVETGADAAEFILLGSDTVQAGGLARCLLLTNCYG